MLGYSAIGMNSATYDETAFVPAGYSYLARHDYRLSPGHPPLAKMLSAIPLLRNPPVISAAAERAFSRAAVVADAEFIFGDQVLYQHNEPSRLLRAARAVSFGFGACLVALVSWWSWSHFGPVAGLLAGGVAAADPNLLAHATLATTDLIFTVFLVAAVFFVAESLRRLSVGNVCAAGIFLGAAFATKHSAVVVIPIVGVAALLRIACRSPWPRGWPVQRPIRSARGRVAVLAVVLCGWSCASVAGIWAAYGFRYEGTPDSAVRLPIDYWTRQMRKVAAREDLGAEHAHVSEEMLLRALDERKPSPMEHAIALLREHRLLPEAFLYGLAYQSAMIPQRINFANGLPLKSGEWAWYYPFVLAVKTPCVTLGLLLMGLGGLAVAAVRRRWAGEYHGRALLVLVPPSIMLAGAIGSGYVTAYRHLLPIVPFVGVFVGWMVGGSSWRVAKGMAAMLVVALLTLETLAVRPYFLSFFNAFVGGTKGGFDLLSADNLDWGQGLVALREWMDAEDVEQVNLAYYGTADPAAYGVRAIPLRGSFHMTIPGAGSMGAVARPPQLPGYVAISVTYLQGTYLPPGDAAFYAFLRDRKPVAFVGGSIIVYWLDRWGA